MADVITDNNGIQAHSSAVNVCNNV